MNVQIPLNHDQIVAFCQRWNIREFALFGSVLREDFRPDSDVDVLVTFVPNTRRRLVDLLDMQDELAAMFGRKVDLVERRLVEQNQNYIVRKHILRSAETVYAK